MPSAVLVLPGRLETLTGGYGYDRRIVQGLRALGWTVDVREIIGTFPTPSDDDRAAAATVLAEIPDGQPVLFDGLAFAALPDEVARHAQRLRLVALVHHPLADETGLEQGEARRLRESERRALTFAMSVVVTSRATANLLDTYGVKEERVTVIEPGTDAAALARGSAGPRVHLLCVATLVPRKGHQVLLHALTEMTNLPWKLTCVGSRDRDAATAAALEREAARAELAGRVEFTGEMDGETLARCYDSADVFVLPTLFEGYGMVVAEALAHGLPVVATRTGAIGELVSEEAGILVAPGDVAALRLALARVVGEPSLRAQFAEGARARRHLLPTWAQSCAAMARVLSQAAR